MKSLLIPRLLVLAAAPLFGLAACSGKADVTQTPATTPATGFPAAIARAICENAGSCCASGQKASSASDCESAIESALKKNLSGAVADADATACVDAVRAAAKKCQFTDPLLGLPACDKAFMSAIGEHLKKGDACTRTCKAQATAAGAVLACIFGDATGATVAGGACSANDGLYCDPDTKKCAAQIDLGAACTSDESCADSFCPHQTTCTALAVEGDPCKSSPNGCEFGLFCDVDISVCNTAKGEGETCTFGVECASGTCMGAKCSAATALLDLACSG